MPLTLSSKAIALDTHVGVVFFYKVPLVFPLMYMVSPSLSGHQPRSSSSAFDLHGMSSLTVLDPY